jgi:hypothetical protein
MWSFRAGMLVVAIPIVGSWPVVETDTGTWLCQDERGRVDRESGGVCRPA